MGSKFNALKAFWAKTLGSNKSANLGIVAKTTGFIGSVGTPAFYARTAAWAAKNPLKSVLMYEALTTAGGVINVDEMTSLFGDGLDATHALEALAEIQENLNSDLDMHTGDGDANTFHGSNEADYVEKILQHKVTNGIIDEAVEVLGSVDALLAVRRAIILENADFELYDIA